MLYGYLPAVITGFLFMVRSALLLVAWSVATKPANKADAEKNQSAGTEFGLKRWR